ncbi:hypothetical protein QE152_g644 [Popillia japonica]|uniref:Proteasome assembly chaperone 1 n=1 Tax=Popillia japonica TaxID=7064 RepID=A0AAW1NL81_POPJA
MVFGELVIPTTRALWDDEEELQEYVQSDMEWEHELSPDVIDNLYVVDTSTVIKLFEKCILTDLAPVNRSKRAGVRIYQLKQDTVVLYEHKTEFVSGEIIQSLRPFIDKAKNVYGITSSPIALYQSNDAPEDFTCFVRCLSTGITANLMSYCIHNNRGCQLFIGYVEQAPLDSINSEPFLRLFGEIGLEIKSHYNMILQAPSNNLYM